jgi:LPXTG-motif cell wall-anchored protein
MPKKAVAIATQTITKEKMKKQLLAAASVASIALAGLAFAAPAQALTCGTPALYVNGTSMLLESDYDLWVHGADGALLETVAFPDATQGYGDIALSADAQTIYGVQNGSTNDDVIDLVDPTTGAIKSTLTITGAAAGIGSWVGAAIVGDGKLVIGSNSSNLVFKVDVTTGASTQFTDLAASDLQNPQFFVTTGDFAQLPDGDVVALYTNQDNSDFFMARIAPDGTLTTVGTVVEAWGAGRVGDDIQLAQADGIISKIAISAIPTAAGTGALSLTTVVDTGYPGGLYGAAGTQDSGTQTCPALANTGIDAGALGALGLGLGFAGAAGLVIARRKIA